MSTCWSCAGSKNEDEEDRRWNAVRPRSDFYDIPLCELCYEEYLILLEKKRVLQEL